MEGVAVRSGGGGTTLSDVYQKAKRLQLKIRDSVERLERLESSSSAASSASPEFAFDIKSDISQLHSLCTSMDNLWRSVAVKSQRDIWKSATDSLETQLRSQLEVEQVAEEAYSLQESLDKYFSRNQRRMQEAKERAELLGGANGESSHVLRIFDDEARAMQSARNSSRMLEDAYSTGVAILSKFSEQRESMKSAQRKLLDILNTVGLSNSVLRLIERRNRVDTWIKYAGMILTFVVLFMMWRWKH